MNHENTWLSQLQGKTIKGVRPTHDGGPVPQVNLMFTDGTAFLLSVKPGVFFEGCLINTLRKAQPIHNVVISTRGNDTKIDIRSKTFPLMHLRAVNKELGPGEFPFLLEAKVLATAGHA